MPFSYHLNRTKTHWASLLSAEPRVAAATRLTRAERAANGNSEKTKHKYIQQKAISLKHYSYQ